MKQIRSHKMTKNRKIEEKTTKNVPKRRWGWRSHMIRQQGAMGLDGATRYSDKHSSGATRIGSTCLGLRGKPLRRGYRGRYAHYHAERGLIKDNKILGRREVLGSRE